MKERIIEIYQKIKLLSKLLIHSRLDDLKENHMIEIVKLELKNHQDQIKEFNNNLKPLYKTNRAFFEVLKSGQTSENSWVYTVPIYTYKAEAKVTRETIQDDELSNQLSNIIKELCKKITLELYKNNPNKTLSLILRRELQINIFRDSTTYDVCIQASMRAGWLDEELAKVYTIC